MCTWASTLLAGHGQLIYQFSKLATENVVQVVFYSAHVPGLLLVGHGQLVRQSLYLLLDEQEVRNFLYGQCFVRTKAEDLFPAFTFLLCLLVVFVQYFSFKGPPRVHCTVYTQDTNFSFAHAQLHSEHPLHKNSSFGKIPHCPFK